MGRAHDGSVTTRKDPVAGWDISARMAFLPTKKSHHKWGKNSQPANPPTRLSAAPSVFYLHYPRCKEIDHPLWAGKSPTTVITHTVEEVIIWLPRQQ